MIQILGEASFLAILATVSSLDCGTANLLCSGKCAGLC